MSIKSQHEVKRANEEKENKIPRSMEKLASTKPQGKQQEASTVKKNLTVEERLSRIENYLVTVDKAFEKIAIELDAIKNINVIIQGHDNEISKITGDFIRLTHLEEDRYIELVNAINQCNDKITAIDQYLPVYLDAKLKEYFEEPASDEQPPESS